MPKYIISPIIQTRTLSLEFSFCLIPIKRNKTNTIIDNMPKNEPKNIAVVSEYESVLRSMEGNVSCVIPAGPGFSFKNIK